MPVTLGGVNVTTISIGGTTITKETLGGVQVYGGTVSSRVWYWYSTVSSEPSEYTPYNTTDSIGAHPPRELLETMMTNLFPPANIPVGTIGWIFDTIYGDWFMLMIIEEE